LVSPTSIGSLPVGASTTGGLVLCLSGPTASGKTALALELAAHFPLGLVSVDSAMVYRGMDIGSGKPAAEVLRSFPHALIDIREPWEPFSAGMFCREAMPAIAAIHAAGRVPLLVGGTLLYFRSLIHGLAPLPVADSALRAAIEAEGEQRGWPALHAELAAVDPVAAARIRPADRQRIQRALEVWRLSGRPISAQQQRSGQPPGLRFVHLALVPGERARLYADIERRFAGMMAAGFLEEVAALRAMPQMSLACPAMRAVGYRQLWQHLQGELSLIEACRQAVVATRRLAKRQLTWLRTETVDRRFNSQAPDLASQLAAVVGAAIKPDAKLGGSR